ncbi:MAG: HEAT repeat domain-containing protein [Nitrospirota bacterium]
MAEEIRQPEALSVEIQDIMRTLISAIRTVKLYPPNNPVYSQSVKKSYEAIAHYLAESPEYAVGVQKTYFTYRQTPVGKDGQLNKATAQDLFMKGVRAITVSAGVTEEELLELYRTLALSSEELSLKNGIASILWEKGASHITVIEAGLDDVITTKAEGGWEDKTPSDNISGAGKKPVVQTRRTLVLGDIMTDPALFGASMVELARQTKAAFESVEDRLFTLYQEAGRKIQEEQPEQGDELFDGLAKSILSLSRPYREILIGGKLYGSLDAEIAEDRDMELDQQLPSAAHEVRTGRFSETWTVQQVATLLKKSSSKKSGPPTPPSTPDALQATPLPPDLTSIANELAEYTPNEMEQLKALGEAGMESDVITATVRTLIHLLTRIKNPNRPGQAEKEMTLFSGVVRQLEDILGYLLQNKSFGLATDIIKAFHLPVDAAFKPRISEAMKKAVPQDSIVSAIAELRKHEKDSPEYRTAYAFISTVEREATEVLLQLLAEEEDRARRIFILDLVKDLGKNHIALLGGHLSDERWYVVRNIVNILSETKTDQAIAFLRRAAEHKNIRIRQEVIKGLLSIGGKKAAGVMAKFLRDNDADIMATAVRAFADLPGIGAEETKPLLAFLEDRQIKKKDLEVSLETIGVLGKIGGKEAAEFLKRYDRIRWWKPRTLQRELRAAAARARAHIERRTADG